MLGSLTLRGIHDLLCLPLGVRKDLLLLRLRLGSGGPDVARDDRGWIHYIEYERREYSADCVGYVSLRIFF